MKILLLGKNGQVGWELQRALSVLGEVTALDRHSGTEPQGHCGDLNDLAGLARTVQALRPDVIVNAAAHTAVDKAESEPELARRLNAEAPTVLAQEAAQLGALLVHYSTDYVFNGSGDTPPYDDSVAAGDYDYAISQIVVGLKALAGRPVLLRLGYEVRRARGAPEARRSPALRCLPRHGGH